MQSRQPLAVAVGGEGGRTNSRAVYVADHAHDHAGEYGADDSAGTGVAGHLGVEVQVIADDGKLWLGVGVSSHARRQGERCFGQCKAAERAARQ